jgi:hypothetical protein
MTEPAPKRRSILRDAVEAVLVVAGFELLLVGVLYLAGGHSTVTTFLAWPNGSVWSNELATASLLAGAIFALFRKFEQHHQERLALAEQHHVERLAQAGELHAAMLEHVTIAIRAHR